MTTPDTGPAAPTGERLLGPAEVRALAERLGIRPTKKLGQNFVHDPNTVRRIVRAAELEPDDVVVEVGPGLGSLTLALLPSVAAVHAVEIDPVLAAALPTTVAEFAPRLAGRLAVTRADAMRVRAADLATPPPDAPSACEPSAIVANLPYNVGVPVLLHLLAELPGIRRGLVMVQAEVAERLAAAPGSRTYGVPSAKLAWFAHARRAGPVPRAVFWPVPNVDSGLLAFSRREPPRVPLASETEVTEAGQPARPGARPVSRKEVFAVVDAAFAQRRKALRPALAGWAGSAAAAEEALRAAGVDPMARAETLGIAQFAAIAAARG